MTPPLLSRGELMELDVDRLVEKILGLRGDIADDAELPGESLAVWIAFRPVLHQADPSDREAAWKALCKRTEEVGRMKNAKVWLKKALAEHDATRSQPAREPGDEGPEDEPPAGGTGGTGTRGRSNGGAKGGAVAAGPALDGEAAQ